MEHVYITQLVLTQMYSFFAVYNHCQTFTVHVYTAVYVTGLDLLIQLLPLVLKGQLPIDDDVDLPGPGLHSHLDLLQPGVEAVLTTGEPRGHCSYWDMISLVPEALVSSSFKFSWLCKEFKEWQSVSVCCFSEFSPLSKFSLTAP